MAQNFETKRSPIGHAIGAMKAVSSPRPGRDRDDFDRDGFARDDFG
jgi:hypothetical protein